MEIQESRELAVDVDDSGEVSGEIGGWEEAVGVMTGQLVGGMAVGEAPDLGVESDVEADFDNRECSLVQELSHHSKTELLCTHLPACYQIK